MGHRSSLIVGSRNVAEPLIHYTRGVAALAARAERIVVSGGARGVDRAAMNGALETGGRVAGVLACDLERAAMDREHRNLLLEEKLLLLSPFDPRVRFNPGHAMQRNKAIYALADAALVVNATANQGGTWNGAIEQLRKYRAVPVYVRSTGERSEGIEALQREGASRWPNPNDVRGMAEALDAPFSTGAIRPCQTDLPIPVQPESGGAGSAVTEPDVPIGESLRSTGESDINRAEEMYRAVRPIVLRVLADPKNPKVCAEELGVSKQTADRWLKRLVDEGAAERRTRPVRYVARQKTMLDDS